MQKMTKRLPSSNCLERINELISVPELSLSSSSLCRLSVVSGFGEIINKGRSFRNAAPVLCDRLPDRLHQAEDISCFRRQRKTHLFSLTPPPPIPLPSTASPHCHPPPHPFSSCFAKRNEHVHGLLHGARLHLTRGH